MPGAFARNREPTEGERRVATYFDSSAVLEVLLGDCRSGEVIACWGSDTQRLSSILLEAECVTVLRRIERVGRAKRSSANVRRRFAALASYLPGMTIRQVDGDVLDVLRRLPGLSSCRSLDALHLATAMLFQQHTDVPLKICAFDDGMRNAAQQLNLVVVP